MNENRKLIVKMIPLDTTAQLLIQPKGILDKSTSTEFLELLINYNSKNFKKVVFDLSELIYVSPSGLEAIDNLPRRFFGVWGEIVFQNISELCHQQIARYGINNKIIIENNKFEKNIIHNPGQIQIYSENELSHLIRSSKITNGYACISIRNPDEVIPDTIKNHFQHLCELKFHDAYDLSHLGPEQKIKRIPEMKDIEEVITFYNDLHDKVDGFIVHCWEGRSRSPAIAMGLLYLMKYSELDVKLKLQSIRSEARPHLRIVKFFDHKLGSNMLLFAEQIRDEALEKLKTEISKQYTI